MASQDLSYPRSLLADPFPPGFENGGKRLLAECPEFKLWELYREGGPQELETSDRIQRAERKALFRIKGSLDSKLDDTNARLDRAMALHVLVRFKQLGCWEGGLPAAARMAESFVPLIEDLLNSDDPEKAAEKAGASFRDAVLALARQAFKISDGRSTHVQEEAKGQFQYRRERPTKSLLKERLGFIGYAIKGKDSAKRWEERFEKAGLESLPD